MPLWCKADKGNDPRAMCALRAHMEGGTAHSRHAKGRLFFELGFFSFRPTKFELYIWVVNFGLVCFTFGLFL
ncbi:hypothetical protein ES288_A13G189300v1 [Gossypium darwinii]|uniref:Uncharacterized protein n=2 Tax=Gossypium TaxID=3633 RepID=A0A5D2MM90_GOSTO|nr:hypothetical protein ES288_A13G189300v1 [Gossypium darwinii]TYH92586.1 hypothetical protein ES332_A13G192100v1 [Gossypium tomentosum]